MKYITTVVKVTSYPYAFGAFLSILLLVAGHTNDVLFPWYEALGADWLATIHAEETFLVPLFSSVFVFAHAGLEDLVATIATRCKLVVIAI